MSPRDIRARIRQLELEREAVREFNVAVRLAGAVTPEALELLPDQLREIAPEGPLPREVANTLSGQLTRLRGRLARAEGMSA